MTEFKEFDADNFIVPLEMNIKLYLDIASKGDHYLIIVSRKIGELPFSRIGLKKQEKTSVSVTRHKTPYDQVYMAEVVDSYPPEREPIRGLSMVLV